MKSIWIIEPVWIMESITRCPLYSGFSVKLDFSYDKTKSMAENEGYPYANSVTK